MVTRPSTKHHSFSLNESSSSGPKRSLALMAMNLFWLMPKRPIAGGGAVLPVGDVFCHILSSGK